jgi:metallo-beta-lactamase family protein
MKISFLGAARDVTGSQFLLQINGHQLLLDCGLFQGRRDEFYKINGEFLFDPSRVDAAVLTHSHIDHSGNFPGLVKRGYSGPIYATPVTTHLTSLMLADSANIQESEAEEVSRRNKRRDKPPVEPLYTTEDAQKVPPLFENMPYNTEFEPIPGVTARLVDAGHILGSASLVLDIDEHGKQYRVWCSGDIGRLKLPLVRDPTLPFNADYLIMESTYGDLDHPDPEDAYNELSEVVNRTIARGGKVVIPAFAIGRTQELAYSLNLMMREGLIPETQIVVDSPLAVSASDIFRQHPEFFDKETLEFIREGNSALTFDELTYVRSVQESREVNASNEPMVIISASGMADSGRVLHHLAGNLEDPRATIALVSYQAQHTLGWQLAQGEKSIDIFGDTHQVKADVVRIRGFSAHAGQSLLMEYALASHNTLKGLYLVHGEAETAEHLQKKLKEAGIEKVSVPFKKQTLELGE